MTEMQSNLSKIKPKFRTKGNVTGNFGMPKVKAGSQHNSIGVTKAENISITPRGKYVEKMESIYFNPPNEKMRKFAHQELRRLHYFKVQRLDQGVPTAEPYRPLGC